ncbi:hypothetical protein [Aliiruegeria sabulilitoris]|uniref:hypothetical protein n=1 Tax=Aliiruegeria sabulilitoris TaxID=1510458 RepID=UPI0008302BE2|nr:hypothetical protein [Aliiruegeria sabulilitoris]NDR58732.1 hypothetical protein [Pseudoruegeria sp. M32A2M]
MVNAIIVSAVAGLLERYSIGTLRAATFVVQILPNNCKAGDLRKVLGCWMGDGSPPGNGTASLTGR